MAKFDATDKQKIGNFEKRPALRPLFRGKPPPYFGRIIANNLGKSK